MAKPIRTQKLSKALLDLKFMKRSKLRLEAEKDAEQSSSLFENDITDGMKSGIGKFIIEESYRPIEDLIIGRVSFKGMNPDIEKLMKEEVENKSNRDVIADISDNEMAAVAVSMSKKFMKGKHKKGKHKFLKPDDSD